METQMVSSTVAYERKLIGILRRLPPERVSEVVDFAQFLESQIKPDERALDEDVSEEHIAADNARWDALLATDASQRLLEKMADETLAEIQAGRTRPMTFTEDGDIAPG